MRPPTSLGVKLTIQAAPMPGAANAPLESDAALSVPLQVSGGTSLYVVDATSRRHEDRAKGGPGGREDGVAHTTQPYRVQ